MGFAFAFGLAFLRIFPLTIRSPGSQEKGPGSGIGEGGAGGKKSIPSPLPRLSAGPFLGRWLSRWPGPFWLGAGLLKEVLLCPRHCFLVPVPLPCPPLPLLSGLHLASQSNAPIAPFLQRRPEPVQQTSLAVASTLKALLAGLLLTVRATLVRICGREQQGTQQLSEEGDGPCPRGLGGGKSERVTTSPPHSFMEPLSAFNHWFFFQRHQNLTFFCPK